MGRKSQQFLTLRELKALFKKIVNARDYALFFLAYRHGLRVSEICQLRVVDVHLIEGRIWCSRLKGSISGFHKIDDKEKGIVQDWLKLRNSRSPFLFPGRSSGPISRKTVDRLIKRYGKQAKLPVSKCHFHILKHSIAVHMLEAGAEIKLVQELLGHRNIQNTLVYAQLVSTYRDECQMQMFSSGKVL